MALFDWSKEKIELDKIGDLYEKYNQSKDDTKRKEIYKQSTRYQVWLVS
jgi:hypothetical protein